MASGAPHRLLIVDDTETFRTALEAEACASGRFVKVTAVADGQRAWDYIQTALQSGGPAALPDILITDFYMPNLNGVELMSALRRDPATARILGVMISACESPAERTAAREAGARAFFLKPGNAVSMRGLIEAACWLAASQEAAGGQSTTAAAPAFPRAANV